MYARKFQWSTLTSEGINVDDLLSDVTSEIKSDFNRIRFIVWIESWRGDSHCFFRYLGTKGTV